MEERKKFNAGKASNNLFILNIYINIQGPSGESYSCKVRKDAFVLIHICIATYTVLYPPFEGQGLQPVQTGVWLCLLVLFLYYSFKFPSGISLLLFHATFICMSSLI